MRLGTDGRPEYVATVDIPTEEQREGENARCAYCHNPLELGEGSKSEYYPGLVCDGCHDLGM
jgi:hypothetical protein